MTNTPDSNAEDQFNDHNEHVPEAHDADSSQSVAAPANADVTENAPVTSASPDLHKHNQTPATSPAPHAPHTESPTATPSAQQVPPPYQPQPQPGFYYQKPVVYSENAVLALCLSVFGLMACIPLGIVSFFLGRQAKANAARAGLPLDDKMNIAYILGIVSLILTALIVLFVIVLIGVGVAVDGSSTTY